MASSSPTQGPRVGEPAVATSEATAGVPLTVGSSTLVSDLLDAMDEIVDSGLALQEILDNTAAAKQVHDLVLQFFSESRYDTSYTALTRDIVGAGKAAAQSRLVTLIAGGLLLERHGPRLQAILRGCSSLLRIASQLDEQTRPEAGPEQHEGSVRQQSVEMDIEADAEAEPEQDIDGEPLESIASSRLVASSSGARQPGGTVVVDLDDAAAPSVSSSLDPTVAEFAPNGTVNGSRKRAPSDDLSTPVSDPESPAAGPSHLLPTGPRSKRARRSGSELSIPTEPASMRRSSSKGSSKPEGAFVGVPAGPKADREVQPNPTAGEISKGAKKDTTKGKSKAAMPPAEPVSVLALMAEAPSDTATTSIPTKSSKSAVSEHDEQALRARVFATLRRPPPTVESSDLASNDLARTGSTGSATGPNSTEREEMLRARLKQKHFALGHQVHIISSDDEVEEGQIVDAPSHPQQPRPISTPNPPDRGTPSAVSQEKQLELLRLRARVSVAEAVIARVQQRAEAHEARRRLADSELAVASPSGTTTPAGVGEGTAQESGEAGAPMVSFDDLKKHDRPVAADQDDFFDSTELAESFRQAEVAIAQGASVQDAITGGLPSQVAEDFLAQLDLEGVNGLGDATEEEPYSPRSEAGKELPNGADFIGFEADQEVDELEDRADEEDTPRATRVELGTREAANTTGGGQAATQEPAEELAEESEREGSPTDSQASSVEFILETDAPMGSASTLATTGTNPSPSFVPDAQICRLGPDCQSPICAFAHRSPNSVLADYSHIQTARCPQGTNCDDEYCRLTHPSPAAARTPRCRYHPAIPSSALPNAPAPPSAAPPSETGSTPSLPADPPVVFQAGRSTDLQPQPDDFSSVAWCKIPDAAKDLVEAQIESLKALPQGTRARCQAQGQDVVTMINAIVKESPTATLESAVSGLNLALDPTGRSTEEHGLRLQRVRAQLIQHPCLPALLERYRKMTVWWQQLQHLGNKMVRPKSTKWSKGQVDTVEHLTARLDEYEVENRLALQLVGQLIVSPS